MTDRKDFRDKATALVAQMTIEEAASQLLHEAPAIPRLGIPEYNWWNEALHGVGRAGTATVFPQAIGMAASFDAKFLEKEAETIADEARAKYNAAIAEDDHGMYKGLTYWSPNINIFRDPRWGRGQETYGEDPELTTAMGNAFIKGLQQDGQYLKIAACAKHFAVHSGPEELRHSFNVDVTPKDLEETYLPAFESAVKDAKVEAVMGAYNAVNGQPCCGNEMLLKEKLRGEWQFDGHVVSDCFAVKDFHEEHHFTQKPMESASWAVKTGCDLNCGCTYNNLLKGLAAGLISEQEIRQAAVHVMTTRFALGMFDPGCEYNQIPYSVVASAENKKLALEAALRSIVLLKNDGILPLDKNKIQTIGVIGPNAYSQSALYGNYHGDSDCYVTDLDGIRAAAGNQLRVYYAKGCHLWQNSGSMLSEAMAVAKNSDVIILCTGLDESMEGEQGDAGNMYGSGDKETLLLPRSQQVLLEKMLLTGKPVIVVNHSGSAIDMSAYEQKCSAILQVWYPGERGGDALSQILFGEASPSGKLPVTFYYDAQPMPEFTDYHMKNRTYKFIEAAPWYPFGYGLSYTQFLYKNLQVKADSENICITVDIENTGNMDAYEIPQCYVSYTGKAFEKPHYHLIAFEHLMVKAGTCVQCKWQIPTKKLASVLEDGSRKLLEGSYVLYVGGCQPDERSIKLLGKDHMPLTANIEIAADKVVVTLTEDKRPYIYEDRNCYVDDLSKHEKYNLMSPICELTKNPEIFAMLLEELPLVFGDEHPMASMLRGFPMGLKELINFEKSITPEKLEIIEAKLKEFK